VCGDKVVKAFRFDIGVVVTVKKQRAYSMSDAFAGGIECESAHVRSMSFMSHRRSTQVALVVGRESRATIEIWNARRCLVSWRHREGEVVSRTRQ
jgi:hypothetical protein